MASLRTSSYGLAKLADDALDVGDHLGNLILDERLAASARAQPVGPPQTPTGLKGCHTALINRNE